MKIHRLRLQHVKGVVDAEIELPDTGVVVIEGPNEVGKSTFLEALDRLLDPKAKAHSKAAGIMALQPVGHDVGPFAEVELSLGPYRLIFTKRWLRQSGTTLRVLQPIPEQLSGEAAQARMTAILDECLDRPLFEALRFAQAGPSSHIRLSDSAVLTQALDAAAGADLHTEGSADLLHAVEAEYSRYFTAVNGRPTGELRAALTACTLAQDAVAEAHRGLHEAEVLVRQRDDLADLLAGAEGVVPVLGEKRQALAEQVAQARRLREREQEASATMQAAVQHRQRAEADGEIRERLRREITERSERLEDTAKDEDVSTREAAEAAAKLRGATARLQAARRACTQGQEEADAAAARVSSLQAWAEVTALQDRVRVASALDQRLSVARRALRAATVSAQVLREIEQAEHRLALAQNALEAGATVVTMHALSGQHEVCADGGSLTLSGGGGPVDYRVTRGSDFTVDGAVRIEVRPHRDVARQAEQRDALQQDLTDRLAAVAARDGEHARALAQEHQRADADVVELERGLEQALAGSRDLAELSEQRDQRQAWLQQCTEGRDTEAQADGSIESASGVPDIDQARHLALAAQQRLRPLRKARDDAEDEMDRMRKAEAAAARTRDLLRTRRDGATAELDLLRGRLAEARAQLADDQLHHALSDARVAAQAATSRHDGVLAELRLSGIDELERRLSALTADCEEASARRDDLKAQFHELKGRLEMAAGEGRQEEHDRAEQHFAEAQRSLDSVGRRARAARQLHLTLQRHRDSAHASYVAPYAREIERVGRAIYGSSFGVRVSPDLVITHRELHGATVAFEHLSGGAKEQLGILARLAVAVLVDVLQSVPVVIDDALGYTDPERLQRLGAVLGDASHLGQIVLLTCTPARYTAIPGAQVRSISA
ncbi:MAG: AAA family ATPase [Ornithinimicrobium sp.]